MKALTYLLRILNACLLIAALFLCVKVYGKMQSIQRLEEVISKEEAVIKENKAIVTQTGMIDSTFVMVAYPIDESGNVLSAIETDLKDYIQDQFGDSQKVSNMSRLAFLDSKISESGLNNVTKYELQVRRYQKDKDGITKRAQENIKEVYIRQDTQVFDLTQLVKDSQFLKDKLITQMEKELSSINQLDQIAVQKLENLKQSDFKRLLFQVDGENLKIQLPEKIGDKSDLVLPLSDLYDQIDASYLKGKALENYQAYEKEKEEALRKTRLAQANNQVVLEGNVVALTFDDGPNASTTPRILDILKGYQAKATFFVIGKSIAGNEELLKRMKSEGHEIGNHTWSHPSLPTLSADQITWQVNETSKAITKVTGDQVTLLRPPYGATNASVRSLLTYPQIMWDVDTEDWKNRNTESILANVKAQLHPGAVILLHDIHGSTADALPVVMDYLVSQGYRFVTISELYGY
ncbi:polysaccharide deacetylase family protein [Streptococcus plurextorum]|uniref:polysaccharide deacetylase family protein n=1 Tax=Streptococcus plurextorum TaxID=456876 RepID=UPI00041917B7|nr:polysaccharide deacetylase family protein [Streptococcus plurextorum]